MNPRYKTGLAVAAIGATVLGSTTAVRHHRVNRLTPAKVAEPVVPRSLLLSATSLIPTGPPSGTVPWPRGRLRVCR